MIRRTTSFLFTSSSCSPQSRWLKEQPFSRAWLNAYTLLVPGGERFIIRTMKEGRSQFSQTLQKQMELLFFQEGSHAVSHQKACQTLEQEGYKIKAFKKTVETVSYSLMEPVSPWKTRLCGAAAIEHVNMSIAEYVLRNREILLPTHHETSALLGWHFAEEIEHKTVVFEGLEEASQSLPLRVLGFHIVGLSFLLFLLLGALMLATQDRTLFTLTFWKECLRFHSTASGFGRFMFRRAVDYHKRNFHPNQYNNRELIAKGMVCYHNYKEWEATNDTSQQGG